MVTVKSPVQRRPRLKYIVVPFSRTDKTFYQHKLTPAQPQSGNIF
jgi:hypothetical protein